MHVAGSIPAALIAHGGVMSSCGVHVGMPQRVRHQVDVLGFMIEARGIGAAQLMGTHALFQRNRYGAILFHQRVPDIAPEDINKLWS